ncbi:MAG: GtrA family protein [Gammaproteobacteria bacterium]|nr:GtrA family protein [Gammaproteobacteria bacterium]
MQLFFSRQFLIFLLTGGLAALVNFGSRIIYSEWLSYSSAILAAYVTGMVTAFLLARTLVFTSTQQSLQRSFADFSMINVLAVIQVWGISMLLASYLLPAMGFTQNIEEIAHAAGVIFPVFTSYLGHKYWSFR